MEKGYDGDKSQPKADATSLGVACLLFENIGGKHGVTTKAAGMIRILYVKKRTIIGENGEGNVCFAIYVPARGKGFATPKGCCDSR